VQRAGEAGVKLGEARAEGLWFKGLAVAAVISFAPSIQILQDSKQLKQIAEPAE